MFNWLMIGGAALVGLIIGGAIGVVIARRWGQVLQSENQIVTNRLLMDSAGDRRLLISTFRRELANYMIRRSPERFLEVFWKALDAIEHIDKASKSAKEAQFTVLCDKYPSYEDFDTIGTRDHVLYEDALSSDSLENIEEHYLDLMKFHALQCSFDDNWGDFEPSRDEEHLKKYTQRVKDTNFMQRIAAAMEQYRAYEQNGGTAHTDEGYLYATDKFTVYRAHHFAEIRYGIHFSDTDEYGIYSFFVHDENKITTSYYRSNSDFSDEKILDDIVGIEAPLDLHTPGSRA